MKVRKPLVPPQSQIQDPHTHQPQTTQHFVLLAALPSLTLGAMMLPQRAAPKNTLKCVTAVGDLPVLSAVALQACTGALTCATETPTTRKTVLGNLGDLLKDALGPDVKVTCLDYCSCVE